MRATIQHDKGQKEAMRIINESADDLIHSVPAGGIKISGAEKSWDGNTMRFSFKGKMGLFGATVHGTILVNEKDVVLDVELPGMLKRFVSEEKIRGAIETRATRLLA